jgi:hypothetical protein
MMTDDLAPTCSCRADEYCGCCSHKDRSFKYDDMPPALATIGGLFMTDDLLGDLTYADAEALLFWVANQDPSDENAEASVARQFRFTQRLCVALQQEVPTSCAQGDE